MVSKILRLILFIAITAGQFFLPFSVLHWLLGFDDFVSLTISWAWAVCCLVVITSPEPGSRR